MAKLQKNDLTPELIKELLKLNTPAEVKECIEKKGFEISDKGAEKLYEQIEKSLEVNENDLDKVAGGWEYHTWS